MKNIITISFLFFSFSLVNGQDSSFTIVKTYAGFLYTGQGNEQSEKYMPSGSSRIGARTEIRLGDGVIKINPWLDNLDLNQTRAHVFYENNVTSWLNLKIGPFCPRPIAIVQRPHPVSLYGQFEAGAVSIMPGAGAGGNLSWRIADNKTTLGVFDIVNGQRHLPEYNLDVTQGLGFFQVQGSGFYSRIANGAVISLNDRKGYLTLLYYRNSTGLQSGLIWLDAQIWGSDFGKFYLNTVHQYLNDKFQVMEIGYLKSLATNFSDTKVKLLIGLAYQVQTTRSVKLYFLLYLEE